MLLHNVQEPVTLLGQRCGPLLGAARQLLEEIGDNVVQTGAAACANHGVCNNRKGGDIGALPAFPLLRCTWAGSQGNTTIYLGPFTDFAIKNHPTLKRSATSSLTYSLSLMLQL